MRNLRGSSSVTSAFLCVICLALCTCLANGELLEPLIQLPRFHQPRVQLSSRHVVSVHAFGAVGDGVTDDTQAFRAAWGLACSSLLQDRLRSVIEIPAGSTFLVGPIDFYGPCLSRVTFKVSGTIIAPSDPGIWKGLNPRNWLHFHGVKHLTVEGGGVINGMGEEWWNRSCKVNASNACEGAPTAIHFDLCENLKVRNLMTVNSQQTHIAFSHCDDIMAHYLNVNAPVGSPNTDGIHISSSKDFVLKHSMISTGDDCISIAGNSSDLHIKNITCTAGHGISIGSLGRGNSRSKVHEALIEKIFLSNTANGLRIKTWQGGSGSVRRIKYRDVAMENVSNPIVIDQYYCDSPIPCQNQTSAVRVKDISFKHIKGTSATEEAIRFACSDSFPCKEIHLEDIQLTSSMGGTTTTFCWNVKGSFEGVVFPPPCWPFVDGIIDTLPRNDAPYSSSS